MAASIMQFADFNAVSINGTNDTDVVVVSQVDDQVLVKVADENGTVQESFDEADVKLIFFFGSEITIRSIPSHWQVIECTLITGSVVISVDYFKRFLAGLRMIFGGRVKAYETLLDRARREALLRLKEDAVERGCQAVVNVRLETCRLANARKSQSIAGLEVLAFGTGVKLLNVP